MSENNMSFRERSRISASKRVAVFRKKIMFVSLGILIFFVSLSVLTLSARANDRTERHKTITSVQVKSGDTIWSIAQSFYTEEFNSINDYVEEIIHTNGMSNDTIYSGAYLIIPYYE